MTDLQVLNKIHDLIEGGEGDFKLQYAAFSPGASEVFLLGLPCFLPLIWWGFRPGLSLNLMSCQPWMGVQPEAEANGRMQANLQLKKMQTKIYLSSFKVSPVLHFKRSHGRFYIFELISFKYQKCCTIKSSRQLLISINFTVILK